MEQLGLTNRRKRSRIGIVGLGLVLMSGVTVGLATLQAADGVSGDQAVPPQQQAEQAPAQSAPPSTPNGGVESRGVEPMFQKPQQLQPNLKGGAPPLPAPGQGQAPAPIGPSLLQIVPPLKGAPDEEMTALPSDPRLLPPPVYLVQPGVEGIFAQLRKTPPSEPKPQSLRKLTPYTSPNTPSNAKYFHLSQIVVKFKEGTSLRLRKDVVTIDKGTASPDTLPRLARMGLEPADVERDLFPLNEFLRKNRLQIVRAAPRIDEGDLNRLRLRAEQNTGREQPDLNLFYFLLLPNIPAEEAAKLLTAVKGFRVVEAAYFQPIPRPASDIAPPTFINVTGSQNYLGRAPLGIDVDFARFFKGGRGAGVRIVDIEGGWNFDHEDMPPLSRILMGAGINLVGKDHGTAVVGQLWAEENGFGATGIVPQSDVGWSSAVFVSVLPPFVGYSVAIGLLNAASALRAGDIALIEQHFPTLAGPCPNTCNCAQFGYVPVEFFPNEHATISVMAGAGIVVVEAAGNGQQTVALDPIRDSGAIMVGASDGNGALTPACFSNTGSRVNVHGWGGSIGTLGYGGVPNGPAVPTLRANGNDPLQWYTTAFGGTSGASPIVTGAAALIQSTRLAVGLLPFDPLSLRALLVSTGTPQAPGPNIGPLPNLRAAIQTYIPDLARYVTQTQAGSPIAPGQRFTITVTFTNSGSAEWTGAHTLTTTPPNSGPGWNAPILRLGVPTTPINPSDTVVRTLALTAPSQPGTYDLAFYLRNGVGTILATSATQHVVVAASNTLYDNALITAFSAPGALKDGQPATVSVTVHNNGTSTWTPGSYLLSLGRVPGSRISLPANSVSLPSPIPPSASATLSFTILCSGTGTGGFSFQMRGPQGVLFGQSGGRTVACQP